MIKSFIIRNINFLYSLNDTNIIILGNQKSGTTAIAKLLALNAGETILLDTPLLWEPNLSKIASKDIKLRTLIEQHKYYFSRSIIKEPNLTFFYPEIKSIYPPSVKFIFIVRDPRDNIRSLLNRINISGNLDDIKDQFKRLTIHEKILFDKKIIPYISNHYIEQLSERWVVAVDVFLNSKENFHLVKYEDFNKDKVNFINQLSVKMGYQAKNDISAKVNIQYQPKGNKKINWNDFFGEKNLHKIQNICGVQMKKLGYKI